MLSPKKFAVSKLKFPYKAELGKIIFPQENASAFREHSWNTLRFVLNVVNIIRLMIILIDWKFQGGFGWINVDATFRITLELKLCPANFPLFLIFLLIYAIYLNYFLYYFFGTGSPTVLQTDQQLNFQNPKAMIKDNKKLFKNFNKISMKKAIELSRLLWKLFWKDENTLRLVCFRKRLSMFPRLSKKNRVNGFMIYLFSELVFAMFMLIYPLASAIIFYFFLKILRTFPGSWFDWLVILFSCFEVYFSCYHILKGSLAVMCLTFGFTSAITRYFGQLNRFVGDLVHKTRRTKTRGALLNIQLLGFFCEHQRMCRLINLRSDHYQVLFSVAILTNIPLNVNCFNEIFLARNKINVAHVIFAGIFTVQFLIGFLAFYPVAYNATAAHRAGKYMATLQPKISNLRLKLKWSHYHEVVHNSNRAIACKVSLFGRLTVSSVLKFVFFYVEAVIFVYSRH